MIDNRLIDMIPLPRSLFFLLLLFGPVGISSLSRAEGSGCKDENLSFHGSDTRNNKNPIVYVSVRRHCDEETLDSIYAFHTKTGELDVLELESYSQKVRIASIIRKIEQITKPLSTVYLPESDWAAHGISFPCKETSEGTGGWGTTLSCTLRKGDLSHSTVVYNVAVTRHGSARYERSVRPLPYGDAYLGILVSTTIDDESKKRFRAIELFFIGNDKAYKKTTLTEAFFLRQLESGK